MARQSTVTTDALFRIRASAAAIFLDQTVVERATAEYRRDDRVLVLAAIVSWLWPRRSSHHTRRKPDY